MYRNVHYKCNKSTGWHGEIWFSTWDENGNPIDMRVPHKSHLCYEVTNKCHSSNVYEYKTLFGKPLEIQYFNSSYERSKWMKEHLNCKIHECLSPEKEFLLHAFEGQQEDPVFNRHPFRVQFIDIECPSEFEFPTAEAANYPIVLITVHDSSLNEFHVWALKDFAIPVEYQNIVKHVFDSERKLLLDWLDWQQLNFPDVISGWNTESYDIPYLVNRCFKMFNDESDKLDESLIAQKLSPVGTIRKIVKAIKNRGDVVSYEIGGISMLDYYSMYRYKFAITSRASWKLGDVCADEIGSTKLSYAGNIWDFCKNDFDNFAKYNIIDVELCVKLDKKLKFINNARQICNFGLVQYESIFKSQPYIYGMLLLQARQEGMTLPSLNHFAEDVSVKDDQFEGAYVFEPQTGFYKKGVFSVDFNSLYPNIMISLNISPETKLAKIKSQNDTHVELVMHPSNDIKRLTVADFAKLKAKTIISANNVIYCRHETKHGIIAKFCDRMYSSRVATKKKMKSLEKNDDQSSKFEYDRLDIIQVAYKIIMNSIYGIMGNKYFSMFDLDNAMAITLTGQALIQNSATYVNSYFRNNYNADYDVVLAGDTDSLYINARPYVEAFGGIPIEPTGVRELCNGLDKIVEQINDNCKSFIMETFNTNVTTIQFKRETFCAAGCFVAKKRYVLHVIDAEGVAVDKFKYVGVDIKKNELPKDIKSMLRLIVEGAMKKHWNNAAFQKIMINIREKYLQFPPEKIAFLKNYGTEKKADSFLEAEKGAGMHAKAVIYHNQLIKTLKIQNKEEEIFVNDRFRYVQVKPINGYNIDVIAFKENWPEEFSKYFMVDYDTMFQKTMCSPLKAFIKAFGWKEFKFIDTISGNIMDL